MSERQRANNQNLMTPPRYYRFFLEVAA